MSYLDYFFIFIVFFSFLAGCYRGFTRELLSLIGWILAFYFANLFSGDFLEYAPFDFGEHINFIIIYMVLFIIILLFSSFVATLLNNLIKNIGLGFLNIIMGSIFGFLRGILITFIIIFLVEKTSFIGQVNLVIKKTLSYLPYEWSNKVKYDPILT